MKKQNYDALAKNLGFRKLKNQRSHGQPIYKRKRIYITPDVDSHVGGIWKMATSPENLKSKHTRLGTYNENLTVRMGD